MTSFRENWKVYLSLATGLLVATPSLALEKDGTGALASEAVVLYKFNEGSGTVINDHSSIGTPLNLNIDSRSDVIWQSGGLMISQESLIRTAGPATKLINQCKGSNEVTIETWIQNTVQNDLIAPHGPLRIVTLSRGAASTDLFLGHNYDGNHFFQVGVRNQGGNLSFNNDPDDGTLGDDTMRVPAGVMRFNDTQAPYQHVYFTRDSAGASRIYVSDRAGIPVLRSTQTIGGDLTRWSDQSVLALANEINAFDDAGQPFIGASSFTAQDRPWRGVYRMVAIYCRALSQQEILGVRNPTPWLSDNTFPIDPFAPITAERKLAQKIYKRVVGISTPIDNPILAQMEADIRSGNLVTAAARATTEPGFYNRTVKDFAKRMSNRDESVDVPLNDFAATVIGHVRDGNDARQLAYGNFYYRGNPERTAAPSDTIQDFLMSNNHYQVLEQLDYNLADSQILIRQDGQKLYDGNGGVVNHKDPAGVITSRAFTSSHAIAGTNRRMVEFSFRQFLCRPIKQWADNTGGDAMVGRDVDRFPGGSHVDYQTTCRGCHSQMDPLRQAFARITFENGFLKHTFVVGNGNDEDDPRTTEMDPNTLIVNKMNQNAEVFPGGWASRDTKWKNQLIGGVNKQFFEWGKYPVGLGGSAEFTINDPSNLPQGNGMGDFGRMIASAGAFPNCMATRVFRSVCKREPEIFDEGLLKELATKFATEDNFRLKKLFERVAVTPNCLGD
ncbi:MAG: hypothetical protein H6626_03185 [Pseudobdellovibrionaceae bacterium]|nr:MAG: hypothetical protein H6626_03185 [Pseudobdellovibrionaceae bacterium]